MELELVLKSNLNMEDFRYAAILGGLVKGTDYSLLHLPQQVYQIYCDMAQSSKRVEHVDATKRKILKELISYVEENYPGYTVLTFEDYSRIEAGVRAAQTGFPFTWGMWVLLGHGKSTLLDPKAEIPQQTAQGGDTFITNTEENWSHDQRRQITYKDKPGKGGIPFTITY